MASTRLLAAVLHMVSLAICFVAVTGCSEKTPGKVESQSEDAGTQPVVDYLQEYAAGNFEAAIPYIRERLEKNPRDAREWFRLGYALHNTGVFDEAIDSYRKAAELDPKQRRFAYYNWACALAMQGEKDSAIERLKRAVEIGFNRKKTIIDDPDLDSLKNDPRFSDLVKSITPPEGSREFVSETTEFDFWVGNWNLQNANNNKVLNSTVSSEHNGYLIRERWQGSGTGAGSSMSYFDPVANLWKQVRITDTGTISQYTGSFVDGAMRFEGRVLKANDTVLRRRTYTPVQDERAIDVLIQESLNDGKDWDVVFRGRYEPRKPRLAM